MILILSTLRGNQGRFLPHSCKKTSVGSLSYEQVSDILDNYSIPSVDCLFSPTLDNSILNQVFPPKFRKYTQKRDKELASVQRAMLNITGPLCFLHDALTSNKIIPPEDIRTILE